jgi:hypothetical membrane protein
VEVARVIEQVIGTVPGVSSARTARTRRLLWCGVAAGPLFVVVTTVDALMSEGFDIRRHGISLLSLGDRGWIQVLNFIVAGLLSISFGEGVRRVWVRRPGATAAPVLIWGYGLGLVGTGLFLVDPGAGFPRALDEIPDQLSWHGAVHAAAPPLAFLSLAGVTFVFARRFAADRRRAWALWSVLTGLAALALIFWPGGGGSVRSAIAVVLTSTWLTAVAADLIRRLPPQGERLT